MIYGGIEFQAGAFRFSFKDPNKSGGEAKGIPPKNSLIFKNSPPPLLSKRIYSGGGVFLITILSPPQAENFEILG